jgi:hypothetical protein
MSYVKPVVPTTVREALRQNFFSRTGLRTTTGRKLFPDPDCCFLGAELFA